jgi:integrase
MSVRKRKWKTSKGKMREAYVVDYVDQRGERHIETFERKKEADARHATIRVDVAKGIHTPGSKSITIAQAATVWITSVEGERRERSTLAQYQQHIDQHIIPRIGGEKLATLTSPRVEAFRDELLRDLSRILAKKVLTSLKSILKDARRRGNVAQNVATDVSIKMDKRGGGRLKVGVDIPTREEVQRIIAHAAGRGRPFLITAIFTGLRASELRGLRWDDVNLNAGEIVVHQRADRYNTIGWPKSKSSARTVPVGPIVMNTLREWKFACPNGKEGLVFPNGSGNIENHGNIVSRLLWPAQIAANVTAPNGTPKYKGLHAFRHFYASWCINRRADGGLELPIKVVQERLGHSSIIMTSDRYGHLFPRTDDGAELAAAERDIMGSAAG